MHDSSVAYEAANAVRKRMFNPAAWEIDVWENLGWHWQLKCANVSVSPSLDKGKYFAQVADEPEECGYSLAAWNENNLTYDEPQNAVNAAVREAAAYAEKLMLAVNCARQACKGMP